MSGPNAPRPSRRGGTLAAVFAPLRLILADRLAVTGLVMLALVVTMALAAPWVATHDPNHILEEEESSVFVRGDDGSWRLQAVLGERALTGAAVTRSGDVVAVGFGGSVHRLEDGVWHDLPIDLEHDLYGIDAADGRTVVVGSEGTVVLLEGTDVRTLDVGTDADLRAVAATQGGFVAVGADETIVRIDPDAGTATSIASPVGRGMALNAVARDGDHAVLAVGERGLALRIVGDAAEPVALPTFRDLNGIHVAADGSALVVGERGTLLRRVGGAFTEDAPPDTRAMRGAWIAEGGERAFAAGRNGVLLEFDGDAWTRAETDTERHFRAAVVTEDRWLALGSDPFVNKLAPPSTRHWFGTDHLGRDLFSQNVYGSRVALLVGFVGAVLVVLIGANVGLFAGYYRGRTDDVLMRVVDVMYGIPFEPFAMILVLLFDPSLLIVILAVSLLTWRTVARLIRSQVLSLAERPFVKAARVAGASDLRILYLHIAPNILPLVFLQLAIIVGASIIAEATLSFLGLGPPQSISWGGILHNARLSGAWRTAWWWNIPPGVFIMITVLSVFFVSRALEVVANPRLRSR